MLPIPWQIGLFGAALALPIGFFLGLSLGTLFSVFVRRRHRYALDGIAGMIGFLAGCWLSAASARFAIELNGTVVGWQQGASWPLLRAWAYDHGFLASIIGCAAGVALGRVLALAAAQRRASQVGGRVRT